MDAIASKIRATYDRLFTIAQQVRSSAAVTDRRRMLAKSLTAASNLLSDSATDIADDVDETTAEIFALADKLANFANIIGPKAASELWKDTELKAELATLMGMIEQGWTSDFLTDEEVAVVRGINTDMSKPGGIRGTRTVAEAVEGQALRVMITRTATGESLTKTKNGMRGNAAQSVTNLAAKVAGLFNVTDKNSDEYKVITEYARQACGGDVVTFGTGDNAVTLTPVFEDSED